MICFQQTIMRKEMHSSTMQMIRRYPDNIFCFRDISLNFVGRLILHSLYVIRRDRWFKVTFHP